MISASLVLLIFLGAMGWVLNRAFEQSILSNAEDALRNQVLLLMANIDVDQGQVFVPDVLSEPRLSQAESSLYAQISIPQQGIVWRSSSLIDQHLPLLNSDQGEFKFDASIDWGGVAPIYAINFQAVWETEHGDVPLTLQVAEHRKPYLERLREYREQVITWLSILGMSLLVLLLALLNWGLKPLVKVTRQVGEIEQGKRQRFDEDYPDEVSRLTQNLNQLLNFEELRIERQRDVLGNLAHSLKTPLAVLRGLEYSSHANPKLSADVQQQLLTMQNIIDYQLHSASAVGRRRFAKPIEVKMLTQQVINSLQKIHQEKNLQVSLDVSSDTQFFGDQGDWLELTGNLLENAFKWAKSVVRVNIENRPVQGFHRLAIRFCVSDDGRGIDESKKVAILERGVRLDMQTQGYGLGLHIVKGIVDAYDGDLTIKDIHPTGTEFSVTLN